MKQLRIVLLSVLFACPLLAEDAVPEKITPKNLFMPIAQADFEGIRGWCNSGDSHSNDPDININEQYDSESEWGHGFYAAAPAAGDTALLYAMRTAVELWEQHHTHYKFNDPHTFKMAFTKRLEIIRQILFHPNCDIDIKNNNGQNALAYAIAENLRPVSDWIIERMKLEQSKGFDTQIALYQSQLNAMDINDTTKQRLTELLKTAKVSASESVYRELLKLVFNLPWDKEADETASLEDVTETLDKEHFGLKKVKDKILDFLAVRLLNKNARGKILCLVGPPGTGKTSIAQSIANGLGRPFVKMSLGGDNDPIRINGKERVYLGAHAGNIIKGMEIAKVKNPVFLLDEIDKLGHHSNHGDPAAALLEVLDPEQNKVFTDRYIDIPFDLSQVFFVCTANDASQISIPLRDRLEIIEIPGYAEFEKVQIAKNYLIPRAVTAAGLTELTISDAVITAIINEYTFEAGVRDLARHINTLCSKAARLQITNKPLPVFTPDSLHTYLGASVKDGLGLDNAVKKNRVGVANGLAVMHGVQGKIFIIESCILPGGKGELKVTNQFGPTTAQASVTVAFSYARAHAQEWGIPLTIFNENDLIIHTPGGGGDGPSAGIAILSSIVSALTGKPVNGSFAMTGELSLTGQVLPIGGVREKILAAKRIGVKNIIIPKANAVELEEDKELFAGVTIFPVDDARDVLNLVLVK
jgi:ATP-dependent Lon protease